MTISISPLQHNGGALCWLAKQHLCMCRADPWSPAVSAMHALSSHACTTCPAQLRAACHAMRALVSLERRTLYSMPLLRGWTTLPKRMFRAVLRQWGPD